jgi:hypothetical protein
MNRYKNIPNHRKKSSIMHERKVGKKVVRIVQADQMFSVEVTTDGSENPEIFGPFADMRKAIKRAKMYETAYVQER